MLVLSRQRDESIVVGDDRTVMAQLSPLEEQKLRECQDAGLTDLFKRLLQTLGQPTECCVVDIRGDKVRLGINAPRNVPLNRREVYVAKKRDAERAFQQAKAS
jgi:carbon storage regulator